MSFTNLDVPSLDRFQLSFGFQTFQNRGTLLNHQTRVRHSVFLGRQKPGSKLSAKSSGDILKDVEFGEFICHHSSGISNSPPGTILREIWLDGTL